MRPPDSPDNLGPPGRPPGTTATHPHNTSAPQLPHTGPPHTHPLVHTHTAPTPPQQHTSQWQRAQHAHPLEQPLVNCNKPTTSTKSPTTSPTNTPNAKTPLSPPPPPPDDDPASPPRVSRRLHAVPSIAHPARLAPTPERLHTIRDTIAPLSTADLTEILTQTQSKCNRDVPTRGHMFPGKLAQQHPFGPTLRKYGTDGCPVDIQEDWTLEELDAAVAYGAHPSAETPEASAACRQEALEKVQQNLAKLVPWKRLRKLILAGLKRHTKVSPVAAIPHKSRLFRMILDLSTKGQRKSNTHSVNELTNETTAPAHSMLQLGNVLGRFIFMVATLPDHNGPILFCKLDIKDGFWRMVVPENDQEQFCYVLPPDPDNPNDDIMIVVPAALQMGWTSSPAFFCSATETG